MMPGEIWSALNISKQGALDLLRPLMAAGLVQRVGSKKKRSLHSGMILPPLSLSDAGGSHLGAL
jgi:hypothetical protein